MTDHDNDEDDWGQPEDLADLSHPADTAITNHICRWCPATFDSYKSLSLHETGSHREEVCRHCGDRIGIRGLANHELWCAEQKSGRFDDMLPTEAIRARLRDWLERANEPVDRDDVYCLTCEEGDPEFVRDISLPARIRNRGMCWLFPACNIRPELFKAPARRDRRTGITKPEPTKAQHDQAPLRMRPE